MIKTKDLQFWSKKDIEKFGYQIIGLKNSGDEKTATRYCFELKKAVTFEECFNCKKCEKWKKTPFVAQMN